MEEVVVQTTEATTANTTMTTTTNSTIKEETAPAPSETDTLVTPDVAAAAVAVTDAPQMEVLGAPSHGAHHEDDDDDNVVTETVMI